MQTEQIIKRLTATDFSRQLKGFIAKRIPNAGDAEDIMQEVFVKLCRRSHTLREEDKLHAWVYRITQNAIVDYYRKRGAGIVIDLPETLAEPSSDLRLQELQAATANLLLQLVEELPEKYRQAIRLSDVEGVAQAELAKRWGLSFSGAKSRVQRARRQLKELLLQCCRLELDRFNRLIDCRPHPGKEHLCGH